MHNIHESVLQCGEILILGIEIKSICFEMKGFVRAGRGRYGSADISRGDWWVAASIKGCSQSNLSCYLR